MTEVPVIQADRDAAANLLDEISNLTDHNGIGQVADLIRDGEYDEHEATIAFARHRIAGQAELRTALERVVSDCALAVDGLGNSPAQFDSVRRAFGMIGERADAALRSSIVSNRGGDNG